MKRADSMLDYYDDMNLYIKTIVDRLENDISTKEKILIKEIYNAMLKHYDDNELKKTQNVSVSFENYLNSLSIEKQKNFINHLYLCYLRPMIYNYINGDIDLVKVFFNNLDGGIKTLVWLHDNNQTVKKKVRNC